MLERLIKHNDALREWIDDVASIKSSLALDNYGAAYETYAGIPQDVKSALWVAPTKGGIFTTKERGQMKSNEWNDASKFYHSVINNEAKP